MTPDVVVDIGNSRLKWGVCREGRVADVLRLPLDDPPTWDAELAGLPPPRSAARNWAVARVNPPARDTFAAWADRHGRTHVGSAPPPPLAHQLERLYHRTTDDIAPEWWPAPEEFNETARPAPDRLTPP